MLVDAVGQLGDRLPHRRFRAGADLVCERLYVGQVELVHHLQESRASDLVASGLRVQVADDLEGRPYVGPDDAQQLLVGFAADEESGDGHEETLLVDLPAVGPEAPAPEVEGVAAVSEVGYEVAVAEDGGHDGKVVEVAR